MKKWLLSKLENWLRPMVLKEIENNMIALTKGLSDQLLKDMPPELRAKVTS